MNISSDDKLAIVKKSLAGNEGKICEVVRFLGEHPVFAGDTWSAGHGPCWLVRFSAPVNTKKGVRLSELPCPDAWLKPIRDNPGNESFVTEARKSLTTERENDKLKKIPACPQGVDYE